MKTFTLTCSMLLLFSFGLFAQQGLNVRTGGAVTINGNLTITPSGFVPGTPFTDTRDGQTYNTVVIGTQCWFAQNLNIGTKIMGSSNQSNNGIIEKYCYNNDDANCAIYGGLYQWYELMEYGTNDGGKGICPTGWHLPTDAEWTTLTTFLGGEGVAGGKLKEAGQTHWYDPNASATNSSGFTALPGGRRDGSGSFYSFTMTAYFLSSSQYDATAAWVRYLYGGGYENVYRDYLYNTIGLSARCLKN